MRQLFLIEIQWSAVSGFVLADIGDVGQPPGCRFVEMVEGGEGTAIEEVGLDIPKRAFYFTLRLRPPRSAGDGPEAVVGGKSQEARVVDRLFSIVAADDDLHIVVETLRGQPSQVRERGDMLPNCRREVLTFDKVHELAPGISEDIAEGVDAPLSLGGEVDVVRGIIHLPLNAGSGFKAVNQLPRVAAPRAQMVSDNGVSAFKSEPAQFFQHPDGGEIGIAF